MEQRIQRETRATPPWRIRRALVVLLGLLLLLPCVGSIGVLALGLREQTLGLGELGVGGTLALLLGPLVLAAFGIFLLRRAAQRAAAAMGEKPDIRGMTVNEALYLTGTHDAFEQARRNRDRAEMIGALEEAGFSREAAGQTADTVLQDPGRYGD